MAAKSPNGAPDAATLKGFFKRYMADPNMSAPDVTNPLRDRLDEHFGADSVALPTATFKYKAYLEVCHARALEEFIAEEGRTSKVLGLRCPSIPDYQMGDMALSWLLCRPTFAFVPPVFCPPDYAMVPSSKTEKEPCLRQGLVFFNDAEGPGLIWARLSQWSGDFWVEVMTPSQERCDRILDGLREGAVRLSPFPGQILEIEQTMSGPRITFLDRPSKLKREDVILPEGLLDQIERHSIGVLKAQQALINSGRPTKRGLLLHGRPGTGKTHTIKYLTSQMPHATIAIMSAARMHHLPVLREVMDVIIPGVIVLDDVDLIAEDREMAGQRASLFELLDILDGIAENDDLLFIMTTNRPNEIEPAIAARPGRVDQAIEVALPDANCRSRLFDLYCDGLDIQLSDEDRARFLDRTEGVTASFIREVLRRATVIALRDGQTELPITITGELIHQGLDELLSDDNPLTPLLLGAVPKHAVPTVTVNTTRSA